MYAHMVREKRWCVLAYMCREGGRVTSVWLVLPSSSTLHICEGQVDDREAVLSVRTGYLLCQLAGYAVLQRRCLQRRQSFAVGVSWGFLLLVFPGAFCKHAALAHM
jgi:hypothetical protein